MIIIAGSMSFAAADRDDVLASLTEVTEASRSDDGCVEYFWSEDLDAPNTFRFFECWDVAGALRGPPGPTARGRLRRAQPGTDDRGDGDDVRGDPGAAARTGLGPPG